MKRVPDENFGLNYKSGILDPSTLPSRKAVMQALLEAIASVTQFRGQHIFPCK